MKNNKISDAFSAFGKSIGVGLMAGLIGTAAITISQMIEMSITKRKESNAPAEAAYKVLDIVPEEGTKQQFSHRVHWTYGTVWGIARGLLTLAGIKKWAATSAHFAAVLGTAMIIEPALKLAPPVKKWGAKEIVLDALHHAIYAVAVGLVYDAIVQDDKEEICC